MKDGILGTLCTGEAFLGLGDDGAGALLAVVAAPSQSFFDSPCKTGCAFQRIDVAARTITSQKSHAIADILTILRTAGDPVCHQIIVGYSTPNPSSVFDPGGFRVQALDY